MVDRYRFAAILACAVMIAAALIIIAQRVNLPGAEIVRPAEAGTGTRCAQGSTEACKDLCAALSDVSTIKCVDHLALVFPRVHDGSRVQGGGGAGGSTPQSRPPPSPSGGGGDGNGGGSPPNPPDQPPPSVPPPTTTPTEPPPPTTTTPQRRCIVNALGIRVCVDL